MKSRNLKGLGYTIILVAIMGAVVISTTASAGVIGGAGSVVGDDCVAITQRPLSDFLDAQGSTWEFFPPVEDMLGWTDGDLEIAINFALVDYAGLANEYIEAVTGVSLGTEVDGSILECELDDGTARISIILETSRALGFAQSIDELIASGGDFLNTPTIFGAKPQEIVLGAEPALGSIKFRMTFMLHYPGEPIPDIRIAFQGNIPDVRPIFMDFRSTTVGLLPDGTRASLRIQQVATADEGGNLEFSRELVDLSRERGMGKQ